MRFIDRDEVARRLTYEKCIPIVREAMIAFSRGETRQLLRSIIAAWRGPHVRHHAGRDGRARRIWREADQRLSGQLRARDPVPSGPGRSLRSRDRRAGLRRHMPARSRRSGRRPPVRSQPMPWRAKMRCRLALLGYGEQAGTHARAISKVRALESIAVWGRSPERAQAFAERMQAELELPDQRRATVHEAVGRGRHHLHRHRGVRADSGGRMGTTGHACERCRLRLCRAG